MAPLLEAADQEVMLWRDRWNDIEVPETWNMGCLNLLVDADEAYRARHIEGMSTCPTPKNGSAAN